MSSKLIDKLSIPMALTAIVGVTMFLSTSYASAQITESKVIFSDDFETGINWTKTNNVVWYTYQPKNDTHSTNLRYRGAIEKSISLEGYSSIKASFSWGAYSLDKDSEYVKAEYFDGTNWNLIERINNGSVKENRLLNPSTFDFPTSINNSKNFKLRFAVVGSGTGDHAYIDDVVISGIVASNTTPINPIGPNDPTDPTEPPVTSTSTIVNIPQLTTWQWQLTGTVDQNVDAKLFNIDLFDNSATVIKSLKDKGKVVICYMSAGSYENWRPDAAQFPASVLGNSNGWAGEKWLDIRQIALLKPVMTARFDLAKQKGCDGIEPDNIDGYTNKTGFPLTGADQIAYNKFLAEEAHNRGLSIGLKNDIDQTVQLQPFFDWALNEQCFQYNECDTYKPFLDAGKAVFNTEYSLDVTQFCSKANTMKMMAMKKKLDLDASRTVCWPASLSSETSTSLTTKSALTNSTNTETKKVLVSSGPLNVRDGAGGKIIGKQVAGSLGTVVSDPIVANGYTWWQVDFNSTPDGWVAGEFVSFY